MEITKLAIGSAAVAKLSRNFITTVEELQEAFRTGEIRYICSTTMLRKIRTVMETAHIEVPREGSDKR